MKDSKCADFGAFCDNGDCISADKICDNVFDCKDFSDERSCKSNFIQAIRQSL